MDSNCGLFTTTPTTDGSYVYTTSYVQCVTYMDNTAVGVGARIDEKVATVWTTRADYAYAWSDGTTYLAKSRQYYCNGHGTDVWRGVGWGQTSDSGTSSAAGSSKSLSC